MFELPLHRTVAIFQLGEVCGFNPLRHSLGAGSRTGMACVNQPKWLGTAQVGRLGPAVTRRRMGPWSAPIRV